MEPYIHGEAKAAVATILAESFYAGKETLQPEELSEGEYVLLSESDIQELYEMEEDV